jgi:hypothetical protein
MLTLSLIYVGFLLLALGQPAQMKRLCPEWMGGAIWFWSFRAGGVGLCVISICWGIQAWGCDFAFVGVLLTVPPAAVAVALTLSAKPAWLCRLILMTSKENR